ncbi:diaminopropionate ammonia-lyase [Ornithinimicrobium panacihumi]|uniref:diaminopropionate ammonia-lyase n=1 Tax=Ornithinimicrobium panacihumi TaxID=2008449 RepID=UPI003F8CED60
MTAPADTWFARPAARDAVVPAGPSGAREFHRHLPGYAATPLVDLPRLAEELGVGRVVAKDESQRLGLGAFKVLGASWAVAQVLARRFGTVAELGVLQASPEVARTRLVTATDGNHGRAVARMARMVGAGATVFVPAVMTEPAQDAIVGEGADVVRVEGDYDTAVRAAADFVAEDEQGRLLVQDTAWEGCTQVPAWIVEGYRTLLAEVDEQLGAHPALVAVPVGVGSLAEAVLRHYRGADSGRPSVLSVEPDTAACVLASLRAGALRQVETSGTIMAGLNCGTVSASAWPVLSEACEAAVAVSDDATRQAMADLADGGVPAGPSGAATLAGVRAALSEPGRREALGIGPDSTVVLLVTEGLVRAG